MRVAKSNQEIAGKLFQFPNRFTNLQIMEKIKQDKYITIYLHGPYIGERVKL